jgi:rfaE bifunctional protein kinase chain/domain
MMDEARLSTLLTRANAVHALVVGDFFLDRYLVIDSALSERSIETGLEAHQVVEVISAPGAAGTVTSNLRALGVRVTALGIVGDDGEGYELRRALRANGVDDSAFVVTGERRTPTYTKPIIRHEAAPPRELERLDIRTRTSMPRNVIEVLIARLVEFVTQIDVVIVADQMTEPEIGTIGSRARAELARLAERHPSVWFLADSRERIGLFEHVIAKPNMRECVRAIFPEHAGDPDMQDTRRAAEMLRQRTGRPVFVTLGAAGMLVGSDAGWTHVPGIPVHGPTDVVGAGDSAMSAIATGLSAGASLQEAAALGNLAAAVTIQQLGTTGTASPQQIMEQLKECEV